MQGTVVRSSIEGTGLDAEIAARAAASRESRPFISPYNDFDVIAGQGTAGLEMIESGEDIDAVFLSVGGGGLAAGVGAALKGGGSKARLIGCWPENAPALLPCMERGEIYDVPERATLSNGTAGGVEQGSVTFDLCCSFIDGSVTVSEGEIRSAMRAAMEAGVGIIEGAAGVALASLAKLRHDFRGKRVVVLLCGANIDPQKHQEAIKDAAPLV